MKKQLTRSVAIVLSALTLLSLSACSYSPPEVPPEELPEEPPTVNYMVDGSYAIKDITPKFKYYTEGLKIRRIEEWKYYDDCYGAEINYEEKPCKYIYVPSEINGDPVIISYFSNNYKDHQVDYLFIGENVRRAYISGSAMINANIILPESIEKVSTFLERWSNLFYLGSKESFNKVKFIYLDAWWFGEDYCKIGIKYYDIRNPDRPPTEPIPVYYYSESEPSESGVYWRYVDGLPVVWQ